MTRLWKRRGLHEMRRLTQLFIDDSPSTIRLIPHKLVERPGGTHKWEPQKSRKAQTFRLLPIGSTTSDGLEHLEGAHISKWDYYLVGNYDSTIEVGDMWCWNDFQYRVRALSPQNNWERRAIVSVFGKAPPEALPSKELGQPPWVEEGWNKWQTERPKTEPYVLEEVSDG